ISARISFVLIWSLLPVTAVAQDAAPRGAAPPPFVRASGEGVIDAKPDQAIVNIGVLTQAATAAAAASQNATQVTAVLDKIKSEIGAKGEIKTVGYSVNPNYSCPAPPGSGAPKIAGYSAVNTVRVTLNDIGLVGRLLDAATSTGANNVNGVQF